MKSNSCLLPFKNLEITQEGRFRACCKIQRDIQRPDGTSYDLSDDLVEVWNSEDLKSLRAKFDRNERPEECEWCWRDEAAGIQSLRKAFNQSKEEHVAGPAPTLLGLCIGLQCNLACRICNPGCSSLWRAQETAANNPVVEFRRSLEPHEDRIVGSLKEWAPGVRHVSVYGGEPFLNRSTLDFLKHLKETGRSKEVSLVIATNGTIYRDDIIEMLGHFKTVSLCLSIDDIFERFEYQRWPAKWSKVQKNLEKFARLSEPFHVWINMAINALNIVTLGESLRHLSQFKIPLRMINILYWPEILSIVNLPEGIKSVASERLRRIDFSEMYMDQGFARQGETLLSALSQPQKPEWADPATYRDRFHGHLAADDKLRDTHYKDYLPELYELLMLEPAQGRPSASEAARATLAPAPTERAP